MPATAPTAASPRLDWADVPGAVRAWVDDELGSPVVRATTVLGGFSPGAAARLRCADGTRAFVKAVSADQNAETPELNRREVRALRILPEAVPHARLLSAYDDGHWVGLLLEEVVGYRPAVPWRGDDLALLARALELTAAVEPGDTLPRFGQQAGFLSAWDDIAAEPQGVDPKLVARLPEMLDHQSLAREVTAGDALVHWDARNDNVLVRDGQAVLVDWAWASRGAPWLDTLLLAVDLVIQGGPDPDAFVARSPLTADVPREHLRAVLWGMVGVWSERARRPAPQGLPTIRTWQAHCAEKTYAWLDGSSWRR